MQKRPRKLLGLFLVVLFAVQYCNTTLFLHTHHFSWGIVTHSHPNFPFSDNTEHTYGQCLTIASLSTFYLTTTVGGIVVGAVVLQLLGRILVRPWPHYDIVQPCVCLLRAPPILIC
jgi:hypothetical protein